MPTKMKPHAQVVSSADLLEALAHLERYASPRLVLGAVLTAWPVLEGPLPTPPPA